MKDIDILTCTQISGGLTYKHMFLCVNMVNIVICTIITAAGITLFTTTKQLNQKLAAANNNFWLIETYGAKMQAQFNMHGNFTCNHILDAHHDEPSKQLDLNGMDLDTCQIACAISTTLND